LTSEPLLASGPPSRARLPSYEKNERRKRQRAFVSSVFGMLWVRRSRIGALNPSTIDAAGSQQGTHFPLSGRSTVMARQWTSSAKKGLASHPPSRAGAEPAWSRRSIAATQATPARGCLTPTRSSLPPAWEVGRDAAQEPGFALECVLRCGIKRFVPIPYWHLAAAANPPGIGVPHLGDADIIKDINVSWLQASCHWRRRHARWAAMGNAPC